SSPARVRARISHRSLVGMTTLTSAALYSGIDARRAHVRRAEVLDDARGRARGETVGRNGTGHDGVCRHKCSFADIGQDRAFRRDHRPVTDDDGAELVALI